MLHSHHFCAVLAAKDSLHLWSGADFIAALRQAVGQSQLTEVGALVHCFKPQGVSAVLLLCESHVAVHYWPEHGRVTLDVHVCDYQADNRTRAERLLGLLADALGTGENTPWSYLHVNG